MSSDEGAVRVRVTCPHVIDRVVFSPHHPTSSFTDGSLFCWSISSSHSLQGWLCRLPSRASPSRVSPAPPLTLPSPTPTSLCDLRGLALVGHHNGSLSLVGWSPHDGPSLRNSTPPSHDSILCLSPVPSVARVVQCTRAHLSVLDDLLKPIEQVSVPSTALCLTCCDSMTSVVATRTSLMRWDTREPSSHVLCGWNDNAPPMSLSCNSSDPSMLLSSHTDGTLRTFDMRSPRVPYMMFKSHPNAQVCDATFAVAGRAALSCGDDGRVLKTQLPLGSSSVDAVVDVQPKAAMPVKALCYEPGLDLLLTASQGGHLVLSNKVTVA